LGCFKDDTNARDLVVLKGAHMKREECALACADYAYFGRQWKGECFCGSSYGKHGGLPSSACRCDEENVGGNRNCVYGYDGEALLPVQPVTVSKGLSDCDPRERAKAMQLCREAVLAAGGELTEDFLDGCVFDVCFGDPSFAEAAAAMQRQQMIRAEEIEQELKVALEKSKHHRRVRREGFEGDVHPNMNWKISSGPGHILWATHPEFCWGLDSGRARRTTRLQLATCDGGGVEFVTPSTGKGLIRLAKDPTLCLDVPGGHAERGTQLHLWKCNDNHPNMVFTMPTPAGSGRIQWAARPEFCLDVAQGLQEAGARIQLWSCDG